MRGDAGRAEGRPAEGGRTQSSAAAPTGPRPPRTGSRRRRGQVSRRPPTERRSLSTCCPRAGTRARRSTSTAAARGGCATASSGSPTGPTSACTASTPAARPGAADARARRTAGLTATPTATSPPTAPDRLRPRAPRRRAAAESRNEVVRARRPRPAATRERAGRPGRDFVAAPRLAPRRRHALLAAVGPPGHAVGRHPALVVRDLADGERDRRRRRAGGVGRSSRVVATRRRALVRLRPHRLVEPLPLGGPAPTDRADRPIDARHRRAAVGVRPVAGTPSSPTAGSCSPTGATASTASPSRDRDDGDRRATLDAAVHRDRRPSARPATTVVVVGAAARRPSRRAPVARPSTPTRQPSACCARRATSASTPADFSVPRAVDVPDRRGGAGRPRRSVYPPANPEFAGPPASCRR